MSLYKEATVVGLNGQINQSLLVSLVYIHEWRFEGDQFDSR